MSLFFNKSKMHYGLVFKDYAIRYAAIQLGKTPVVINSDEHKLPPGIIVEGKIVDFETLKIIVGQCIEKWKIKGKKVSITVPDPLLVVRKVDVPKDIVDEELKVYIHVELGASIHIPIEQPVLDVKRSMSNPSQAVLFAAPEETVTEYVNLFKGTSAKIEKVDVSSLCIYRLFEQSQLVKPEKNYMMLQVYKDSMVISMFSKGELDLLRYYTNQQESENHSLEFSIQEAANVIQPPYVSGVDLGDSLDLNQTSTKQGSQLFQDMYFEIERMINFYRYSLYNGEQVLEHVIICGDHRELENFKESFLSSFQVKLIHFNPRGIGIQDHVRVTSAYFTPVGLCIPSEVTG